MSKLDTINSELQTQRSQLAASLNALTDAVDPQRITNEAKQMADTYGTTVAQQAWSKVRDNPAGSVLVAMGFALMASQPKRSRPVKTEKPVLQDPAFAAGDFDARVAAADAEIKADMTGEMEPPQKASQLRATLDRGLEQLPPEARAKVRKAREAAIQMQDRIEVQARQASKRSKGFVQKQPLAAGALAIGFGMLAGSLLPGTRREDEVLGAKRDALMAEARNMLEHEVRKAKTSVEQAIDTKTRPSPTHGHVG